MRVDFLALRKGLTPLIAGLLVGRQEERTWWRGREMGEAVYSANSVYAAFRDERSPNIFTAKTPDIRCFGVIRWHLSAPFFL
ncbi:hypothetical protein [Microbulbifer variabilis]|uniref:hypothetical protein n=1 Tax=Microbulbifer variabilis TaxID=266805 RepID=UPI001CFF2CB7|nr:hypothetical protein [Microbulbifer variabilis]